MGLFSWRRLREQLNPRERRLRRKEMIKRPHPRILKLERLEDRTLPSVGVSVSVAGIDGNLSSCNCRPPDTNAAAGPSNVVELVNTAMQITDKTGRFLSGTSSLRSFFSGHGFTVNTLTDPVVLFDESVVNSSGPNGRFIVVMLDLTSATATDNLDFAISNDADATHGFTNFRQVNVGETSFFADQPRLGINADAYFVELNMYATATQIFDHPQEFTIQKSNFLTGGLTTFHHDFSGNLFSVDPANMHGAAAGGPEYFVSEGATLGTINVIKETNVLSDTPTDVPTTITVTTYSQPPAANQPSGTITTNDSRMMNAAWRNNVLVATHTVGTGTPTTAHARWYQLDTTSTPTLTQSGEINPGLGIATFFPSIDIDANGDFGMTYMQSSTSEFVSMYVTGRTPSDPTGTMETGVKALAGTTNYTGDRAGDYSGTSTDPATGTSFWSANEFITDSAAAAWNTGIANFTVETTNPKDLLIVGNDVGVTRFHLQQYHQDGTLVSSTLIPQAAPGDFQYARGLTVDPLRNVNVINGVFSFPTSDTGYLSALSPTTQTWNSRTFTGWSAGQGTADSGGVAALNNFVFASSTSAFGALRFDNSGAPTVTFAQGLQFSDLTLGLDGLLYGLKPLYLGDNHIYVYNPLTLAPVRDLEVPDDGPGQLANDTRTIAIDASGNIYAGTVSGNLVKFNPSGSQILASTTLIGQFGPDSVINLALDNDGQLAAGGRDGFVFLTDESLASVTSFRTNENFPFVTFNHYIPAAATSSFVVTNTNDSGTGSLRQAILNSNATPGQTNTVTFDIPGGGVHTIAPLMGLPALTDPVTIDGTSQPGFAGSPLIELSGANAGLSDGLDLLPGAGGSTVKGLVINRWSGDGIRVTGNGNTIVGNYIGTDPMGTVALGNGEFGIQINSSNNVVGGATLAARNLLSSNHSGGVTITGPSSSLMATGNMIQGNFIGTDVTGTAALPNFIGVQLAQDEENNTIGGTAAGEGNLISGNTRGGIDVSHPNSDTSAGNVIQGNFIGTTFNGTGALGNTGFGVFVSLPPNSVDCANNIIGGSVAGANVIAFNTGTGVVIGGNAQDTGTVGNLIRFNSIYSNGFGIGLGNNGVTPNHSGGAIPGPNNFQNFPVITSVVAGSSTTVNGTFNSGANMTYTLDFYASPAPDATGFGQGKRYLSSEPVTTDSSGNATFSFSLTASTSPGEWITATATDASGDTSEFSQAVQAPGVLAQADLVLMASGPATAAEGDNIDYNVIITNNGPDDAANAVLTDVLPPNTSFVSASFGTASVTNGTLTITLGTIPNQGTVTGTITLQDLEEENINNTLSVTSDTSDPNPANNSQTVSTTVSDQAVAVNGQLVTPTEGIAQDLVVATFTDPGGPEPVGNYSADINWGDGHTTVGTISPPDTNGVLSVHGSHAYLEEGNQTITVTVHHETASDGTATSSAQVSDAMLNATGVNVAATEGVSTGAVNVATFTDLGGPESAGDYSATINWGGAGTGSTTGTIVPHADGSFSVQGSFAYAEEGSFTVGVHIVHENGVTADTTSTAMVADAPLSGATGVSVTGTEGMSTGTVNVATFRDLGGSESVNDYSATINWGGAGSGSATGTIVDNGNGTFSVQGSFTYADEGSFTVAVHIVHENGITADTMSTATVADAGLNASGVNITATEGISTGMVTVATFTDLGGSEVVGNYSAMINWGGAGMGSNTGTIVDNGNGTFSVQGSFTYAEEGSPTIAVHIVHENGITADTTSTATVSDSVLSASAVAVTGTEGTSTGTINVATFTDLGGPETPSDYSATINWGGAGTGSSTGTIVPNANGTFSVQGSFTYTEEGTFTVGVHIVHENGITADTTSTATVADAGLSASGVNVTATEGASSGAVNVATFTDLGGSEMVSNYSATINWGGAGTGSNTGTIVDNGNGTFSVQGSFIYADEGSFTVGVHIVHENVITADTTSTATVADAALTGAGVNVTATEGTNTGAVNVATFTDLGGPEVVSHYSATIDWGGAGSGSNTGTIVDNGNGTFSVQGSFTYAEEGNNTIAVHIVHENGITADTMSTATVSDAALTFSGLPVIATEGASTGTVTVATFSDLGGPERVNDYSATINWGGPGSGSNTGTIVANADGTFSVQGSFTYADEGSFTVDVHIVHENGVTVDTGNIATVTDAALSGATGMNVTGTEGISTGMVTVATFSDLGGSEIVSHYSATINWGGAGSGSNTGTIVDNGNGTFSVQGSFTYAEEGNNTIAVHIVHENGITSNTTSVAIVGDANLNATGVAVTATEGTNTGAVTVATFTDLGGPENVSDYSATISWGGAGSGSSTGTIVANADGSFGVQGSFAYAGEGSNTIAVHIVHENGITADTTSTATVGDAALSASGVNITPMERASTGMVTVATFSDLGGAENVSDYSATINWGGAGSGSNTGVIVANADGSFSVQGSFTYAEEGNNTIAVHIVHENGITADTTSVAAVADQSVAATGSFTFSATEGVASSAQAVATFTDPAGAEAFADYSATIAWGDNMSSAGQITVSGSVFTVTGSHLYAEEGAFTIAVTIHHDTSTDVTVNSMAAVIDQAVVATGSFFFAAVEGNLSATQAVATFTDPAGTESVGNYTAQIAWGDNSTSVGSISFNSSTHVFSVRGSHTYADEGNHGITVAISNESAPAVVVSSSATIADAALTATGQQLSVVEGASVSGTIASFTDANPSAPLSDFSATIAWGDGMTSTGSISQSGGSFAVQGMHQYSHDGNFTASVTITDIGGKSASANTTVVVTEPAINATALAVNGFEFTPLSDPAPATDIRVAAFTHAGGLEPPSDFTATIDWGDGSSSTGTVVRVGTTYTVRATHIYTKEATFPVQVTISEDTGGTTATVRTTATTLEELLPDGTRGTANQRWLSEVYRDLLGRAIDPLGLANATNALNMGVSRFQIVSAIESSLEYRMKFVNHLYFTLLGRLADPLGMQISLDILAGRSFLGGEPTVEQLKAMIISSDEYFAKHGSTNSNFLEGLFRDVIGRDIDNSALVALTAQLAQGASRNTVALEVLTSAQAIGVLVQRDYLTYLNRNVDAANFGGWVNVLQSNLRDEDLLAFIVASDEFFARTAQ
jgi:uncharacterized repeat protein (TIGR01451 family)